MVTPNKLEIIPISFGLVALAATPFIDASLKILLLLAVTLILASAVSYRLLLTAQLVVLIIVVYGWAYIWPSGYPFFLAGPLVIYFAVVFTIRPLGSFQRWLRFDNLELSTLILIVLTVLVSATGLLLWYISANPDISVWFSTMPKWQPLWLIPLGVDFALLNAAIEELMFRGIILRSLDTVLGEVRISIAVQAIIFGAIHFEGIPSGWFGVGLATMYGVLLGIVRRRAQGLLAPFTAHVFADLVIFAILFHSIARNGS
jgi:membrane protease YdiL (CAAX protease family)